ncbi:MAG: hypothetical protein KBS91_02590 [Firmicutes bacterium]|nr:hypothetical protein [Candidatus Caballimonas caccae]
MADLDKMLESLTEEEKKELLGKLQDLDKAEDEREIDKIEEEKTEDPEIKEEKAEEVKEESEEIGEKVDETEEKAEEELEQHEENDQPKWEEVFARLDAIEKKMAEKGKEVKEVADDRQRQLENMYN